MGVTLPSLNAYMKSLLHHRLANHGIWGEWVFVICYMTDDCIYISVYMHVLAISSHAQFIEHALPWLP